MCSRVSATDQRSGADLNFHWASERPFVASMMPSRVCSKYLTPLSRSSGERLCANAMVVRNRTAERNAAAFFIVELLFFSNNVLDGNLLRQIKQSPQV